MESWWKGLKSPLLLVLFVLTGLLPLVFIACASIIHGTRQDIQIKSVPEGARVTINGMQYTTPAVATLKRSQNYVAKIEKEGYKPLTFEIRRSVDAWIIGNVVFGGIIGLVVDFSSGGAYKLSPELIQAVLEKQGAKLLRGDKLVIVALEQLENVRLDQLQPVIQ